MQPLRSGKRVYRSSINFLAAQEDIMPTHKKVQATLANCEKDHEAKLKLDGEFEEFEKLVRREAKKSRDVSKLLDPLRRLKIVTWGAAHGLYLVPAPLPKKKGKVSMARATHRARRK